MDGTDLERHCLHALKRLVQLCPDELEFAGEYANALLRNGLFKRSVKGYETLIQRLQERDAKHYEQLRDQQLKERREKKKKQKNAATDAGAAAAITVAAAGGWNPLGRSGGGEG